MTAAQIGDNSKAERTRRSLFSYYHRQDRDIDAQIEALKTKRKAVRQNAKASGFNASKLDHYLKSFKAEDQQKPVDRLKSDRENLSWLGLIQDAPQGDLLADRASKEQLLQAKGFHAGLTGLDRVSGYDGGSSEDRMWLESYDLGKNEFDTELPDILKSLEAADTKETPPASGDNPFPKHDTKH
jgi:Spy/CpxP family protein refolding chaperone